MQEPKVISATSDEEVWKQIEADFSAEPELFQYNAVIKYQGWIIDLVIDIDPGGGFEGGYAFTALSSELKNVDDFRFSLHHQDIIDEIGKLFGMQDLKIGIPEFDDKVIVKTNNSIRLKDLLSDSEIRTLLQSLPEFHFHIAHHSSQKTEVEGALLKLNIEEGITDPKVLRKVYNMFINVLTKLDRLNG